jgi:hypothetical protein
VWRSRLERACVRVCVVFSQRGFGSALFCLSVVFGQRYSGQRYFGLSVVSNLSVVFGLSGFGLNMFGYTALRQYKLAVEQQLYLNSIK